MSDVSLSPLPWSIRFRAWWEGYDPHDYMLLLETRDDMSDDAAPSRIALPELEPIDLFTRDLDGDGDVLDFSEEDEPDPVWPRAKLEVSQRIFGPGFTSPGGVEHAVDLARSLGLDPAHSVLDLSLGLGGPAAAIAERFGIWVTGYESNPALFGASADTIATLKGGNHVNVNAFEPDSADLPRKKFDVVMSRETLHRVEDRIMVLGKIRGALKDWGQFLLTDYVVPNDEIPSDRVQAWMKARGEPVTLWTREQYEVALTNQGMDIRVVKDESAKQAEAIRADFERFVSSIDASDPVTSNEFGRQALMELAEDWARLAGLLRDGELQLMRFLALKPEQE